MKLHSFIRQAAHSTFRQKPEGNSNRQTPDDDIAHWILPTWT